MANGTGSFCSNSTLPSLLNPVETTDSNTSHVKGSQSAPPPPPLPPPPPPQPGQQHSSRRKRRVRSFYWKTIPEEKVRGKSNIWTLAVRQQQYQIDVRTVEELFGQQEEGRVQVISGHSRPGRSKGSFKESKDEISILDSKRGMNVGIFLKQFKKSNHTIVEDIKLGNSKPYGAEKLKELQKLLPEEEELKKLKDFKGNSAKLTLVDSFMFMLIQVPRFDVRIEAMVLQEEFNPSCAVMSREINVIRTATDELMTCEELHAILHLVLQAGNIMNAGGYAGNAVGFKLSSLLSLADTKANKPGMNLLHFVALEAQKKDDNLLKFAEKLLHVQSAARISVENIEAELSSLCTRTQALQEKIKGDTELLVQLDPFLQSSAQTLQDLKQQSLDLRKEGSVLIDFFCEDKVTFKLDECFRIFQDFCLKFNKAVKDNLDRKVKEAARQRRLRELEDRRMSWATTGGGKSGSFGRSSSENDMEVLTKQGLLDFLFHPRSDSPHNTLGRSASARRYQRRTAAESPKFCSLPRSSRPHQRKTIAWLTHQGDDRELKHQNEQQATFPNSETELIRPFAIHLTIDNRQLSGCSMGNNEYNNNYTVSESINRSFFEVQGDSKLNVSVEKHTLVPALQPFELSSPNNNNITLDEGTDVVLTDLEEEFPKLTVLDTPPFSKGPDEPPQPGAESDSKIISSQREEDEDTSTFSSTTCGTPLPLDFSLSHKKSVSYIIDCTEPDCSVMLDFSEGSQPEDANLQSLLQDPSSLSSNVEPLSTNDPSLSTSTDEPIGQKAYEDLPKSVTPSAKVETDSCDTQEGQKVGSRALQTSGNKPAESRTKTLKKSVAARAGRSARTLTSIEAQNLRKVVPITKVGHSVSNTKKNEKPTAQEGAPSRRPLRDQSTPARRGERQSRPARHSSLPPAKARAEQTRSTAFAKDATPRRPSVNKPTAKPVRNIPKPPPEEKMCRSTMRALAEAQAKAQAASGGTAPEIPKSLSQPGFARNTVASSSRTKKDLSAQPVPGTPVKTLSRTGSQRAPSGSKANSVCSGQSVQGEDKPVGSLRRVQSVRASGRITRRSETPPPQTGCEEFRKGSSVSERSTPTRQDSDKLSNSGRTPKPVWK